MTWFSFATKQRSKQKKQLSQRGRRLRLETLEDRRVFAISPISSFEGIDIDQAGGFYPADASAAVSQTNIVSAVNSRIDFLNKAGSVSSSLSLNSFFSPLSPTATITDPKVIFNGTTFIVVAQEINAVAQTSRIMFAESDDGNPAGTWTLTAYNSSINISGQTAAYGLGISTDNSNHIFITANMFRFSNGSLAGVRLWIIDNTGNTPGDFRVRDPIAESGAPLTFFEPAMMYGDAFSGGGTMLVGYGVTNGTNEYLNIINVIQGAGPIVIGGSYLDLIGITTPGLLNVGDIHQNIAGGALAPIADAPQPSISDLIDAGDSRIQNAVYRDGYLYATATIMPTSGVDFGQATAHWFKLAKTSTNYSVAAQGNAGAEDLIAGTSTFYPSISVDQYGGIALGFSASGSSLFAAGFFAGQSPGTAMSAPIAIGAGGQDTYSLVGGGQVRWGDHSSISIDPSDGTFWVYNQYAKTRVSGVSKWGTRFANFDVVENVTIDNFGGGISYTENAASTLVTSYGLISNATSNFANGQITVTLTSGATADDRLEVIPNGYVTVSGSNILVSGVIVGSFSGGVGGTPLNIAFNSNADFSRVNGVFQNIGFRVLGDNPAYYRTLSLVASFPSGGTSNTVTKAILVNRVNDAPTLGSPGSVSYVQNAAGVIFNPAATATDPDSADLSSGLLTVSIGAGANASNRIELSGSFSLSGSNVLFGATTIGTMNSSGGVGTTNMIITFNANSTPAIAQQLIRSLKFRTVSGSSTVTRNIAVTLTDGDGGTSNTINATVTVT